MPWCVDFGICLELNGNNHVIPIWALARQYISLSFARSTIWRKVNKRTILILITKCRILPFRCASHLHPWLYLDSIMYFRPEGLCNANLHACFSIPGMTYWIQEGCSYWYVLSDMMTIGRSWWRDLSIYISYNDQVNNIKYWAGCFQITHFSFDDCEYSCILSHYHK